MLNKITEGILRTIAIHVTLESFATIQEVIDTLKLKVENTDVYEGPVFSYLGESWDFGTPREVNVSAEGFTEVY